jgi:hypothetical protein
MADEGEFPAEVHGILYTGVHALSPGGTVDVCRITGQEHPAGAEGLGQPSADGELGEPDRMVNHDPLPRVPGDGRLHLGQRGRPRWCRLRERDDQPPAGRGAEGEEEERAGLGEEDVHPATLQAVGFQVGQQEPVWVGPTGELDAGQAPGRAVRTVTADHVPRAHHPRRNARRLHGHGDAVAVLLQAGNGEAATDAHSGAGQAVDEDPLGGGLGEEQQERESGVTEGRIGQGNRVGAARGSRTPLVQQKRAGGVARRDQVIGEAVAREDLEGTRLDGQCPGFVRRNRRLVDDLRGHPEGMQLPGEGEPGGAGAHNEHIGVVTGRRRSGWRLRW